MQITATIRNAGRQHEVQVATEGHVKTMDLPAKPAGGGSAINGGELLALALATCCCNDLYREAAKRGLSLQSVEVDVESHFGAEGELGRDFRYRVRVQSDEPPEAIEDLIRHVDRIAEVHNTLRGGTEVVLQPASP